MISSLRFARPGAVSKLTTLALLWMVVCSCIGIAETSQQIPDTATYIQQAFDRGFAELTDPHSASLTAGSASIKRS